MSILFFHLITSYRDSAIKAIFRKGEKILSPNILLNVSKMLFAVSYYSLSEKILSLALKKFKLNHKIKNKIMSYLRLSIDSTGYHNKEKWRFMVSSFNEKNTDLFYFDKSYLPDRIQEVLNEFIESIKFNELNMKGLTYFDTSIGNKGKQNHGNRNS